jgi:hypothetical protein
MLSTQIPSVSTKFNPLQLELLRIFARNPSEQELLDIKRIIGQYYLDKLVSMADEHAEKENWSEEDIENFIY